MKFLGKILLSALATFSFSTTVLAYSGGSETKMTRNDWTSTRGTYTSANKGDAKNYSAIEVQTGLVNLSQKFSAFSDIDINKLTIKDHETIASALNKGTASDGSVIYTSAGIINISQLQTLKAKINMNRNTINSRHNKFTSSNSGNASGGSSINVVSGVLNVSQ